MKLAAITQGVPGRGVPVKSSLALVKETQKALYLTDWPLALNSLVPVLIKLVISTLPVEIAPTFMLLLQATSKFNMTWRCWQQTAALNFDSIILTLFGLPFMLWCVPIQDFC